MSECPFPRASGARRASSIRAFDTDIGRTRSTAEVSIFHGDTDGSKVGDAIASMMVGRSRDRHPISVPMGFKRQVDHLQGWRRKVEVHVQRGALCQRRNRGGCHCATLQEKENMSANHHQGDSNQRQHLKPLALPSVDENNLPQKQSPHPRTQEMDELPDLNQQDRQNSQNDPFPVQAFHRHAEDFAFKLPNTREENPEKERSQGQADAQQHQPHDPPALGEAQQSQANKELQHTEIQVHMALEELGHHLQYLIDPSHHEDGSVDAQ